jgi:hypothetical protein
MTIPIFALLMFHGWIGLSDDLGVDVERFKQLLWRLSSFAWVQWALALLIDIFFNLDDLIFCVGYLVDIQQHPVFCFYIIYFTALEVEVRLDHLWLLVIHGR